MVIEAEPPPSKVMVAFWQTAVGAVTSVTVIVAVQVEVAALSSVTVRVAVLPLPMLAQVYAEGLTDIPVNPQGVVLPLSTSPVVSVPLPPPSRVTVAAWQMAVGGALQVPVASILKS